MTRFSSRLFQVRARFYLIGLLVWIVLIALGAIGGAVTDQAPAAVAAHAKR